ncbi:MAG: hypothetical protein ACYC3I_09455 [Gemmataceae bacterium]
MSRSLRHAGRLMWLLPVLSIAGCGFFSQSPDAAPEPSEEPQTRAPGLRHEVFASPRGIHSCHPLSVLYPPPAPLSQLPPEAKPPGDDVVWAPGYWMWDTSRDDWVWVNGVWVHAPPCRHWVAGYWSVVADGWRWVPGSWAVDSPPPPSSPPVLASSSSATCFDDPAFACFAGYGMWWPSYGYGYGYGPWWGYRNRLLQGEPHGSEAARGVPLHGPFAAAYPPSLLPHLASNVHDAPSSLPHLDMASILASVPKPMTNEFALHPELRPLGAISPLASSLEHGGRAASLFSTEHLGAVFHDHPGVHEAIASHPCGGGHAGGSGGHGGGGGHGR